MGDDCYFWLIGRAPAGFPSQLGTARSARSDSFRYPLLELPEAIPMANKRMRRRSTLLVGLLIASLLAGACEPIDVLNGQWQYLQDDTARRALVCNVPTVRALARDLDALERHIETYGSVETKQPDVWGQARLTQYRDEYEQQMAAE